MLEEFSLKNSETNLELILGEYRKNMQRLYYSKMENYYASTMF